MIGFFVLNSLRKNHNHNNNKTLHYYFFIGITFGIRAINIKIHTNEKSGNYYLQAS